MAEEGDLGVMNHLVVITEWSLWSYDQFFVEHFQTSHIPLKDNDGE